MWNIGIREADPTGTVYPLPEPRVEDQGDLSTHTQAYPPRQPGDDPAPQSPKYHRPQCGRYFHHRFKGVRPRFRASEALRLEVEAHDGGVTQRKITRTHGISAATEEPWYQSQCQLRRSEMSNRPCPRVLGIDEHFVTLKRGYATTMVDFKNHKVVDVVRATSPRN